MKNKVDIKALQLESRFALSPNSLGYCGKDTASERFKKCIRDGICEDVEKEVSKFIVLYPFLKTLAQITSLPVFSYPVIEGYWLGNDQLRRADDKHYDLLLDNFLVQGVPDFFVEELRKKKPKVFIPNHLFQVLHIGVVKTDVAQPFNLKSINNCIIRWGEVRKIAGGKAVVNLHSLQFKNDRYELIITKEIVQYNPELLSGIKLGDIVACHWNMIAKILTQQEVENISYWTKQVITVVKETEI